MKAVVQRVTSGSVRDCRKIVNLKKSLFIVRGFYTEVIAFFGGIYNSKKDYNGWNWIIFVKIEKFSFCFEPIFKSMELKMFITL